MATIAVNSAKLGTALKTMLMADDIEPGSDVGYQLCKAIYLYHPMGGKMVDTPIRLAQSQERVISIPDSPEEAVRKQFEDEWLRLRASQHIAAAVALARIYGIGTLGVGEVGVNASEPIDFAKLADRQIFISTFDPLNTAGSLVLDQDPNSPDFQKIKAVAVSGVQWHRSRCIVHMHEKPVYIAFTTSAYGYVGRSVYQRALYPMKSFVSTMVADDMVARKVGLLIAKMKQAGSIIDQVMASLFASKREMLKDGETDQVLGISTDEEIESLNLQNLNGAGKYSRDNIITNIALAADMPAKLLNEETFAEGFGEGTEDAAKIVRYVKTMREEMAPLYAFMDRIVQHRAWNKSFYATIQERFPEYKGVSYQQAFVKWQNSFSATWPSLVEEPESEKVKVAETKLKAIVDLVNALLAHLDPANAALLIQWAAANFNELKEMFTEPLDLDWEALAAHQKETAKLAKEAALAAPGGGVGGGPGAPGEAEGGEPDAEGAPQAQAA